MRSFINLFKSRLNYYLLSLLSLIIPKDKYMIYVFDQGFKKDNSWALITEIINNQKYSDYRVYYYIGEIPIKENDSTKILFINSRVKACWYKLRAKTVIHSYMEIVRIKPLRNQIILNTMHGSPLKKIGYLSNDSRFKYLSQYEKSFNFILTQSDFFSKIIKNVYNTKESQNLILGYPRNDILGNLDAATFAKCKYSSGYKKMILWMPTWRQSIVQDFRAESNISFPVLTYKNIDEINNVLNKYNILLLIKPHPFQAELELLNKELSNIKTIHNSVLSEDNVELYSLVSSSDALLTDYSSVYFDYLLLNRPIGFTIDDIKSYKDNRGFVVDDPYSIMPGQKILESKDLKVFIENIAKDIDDFEENRVEVNNLVNKYQDFNSSERILDFLLKHN